MVASASPAMAVTSSSFLAMSPVAVISGGKDDGIRGNVHGKSEPIFAAPLTAGLMINGPTLARPTSEPRDLRLRSVDKS
jgi:hypothetical protein